MPTFIPLVPGNERIVATWSKAVLHELFHHALNLHQMKKMLLITLQVLSVLAGCKKEQNLPVPSTTPAPIPPAPTGMYSYVPQAFAGPDFYVVLPGDSALLLGRAADDSLDTLRYNWKKISGPASCVIVGPHLLESKATDLVKGTYRFELTVADQVGLSDSDTISVDVEDPYPVPASNELIVGNLHWIFPWYASVEVKDIHRYPPVRKVFIQRHNDGTWVEVSPLSLDWTNRTYEYFIERRPDGVGMYTYGSLYIFYYGTITNDTPQVRIQF